MKKVPLKNGIQQHIDCIKLKDQQLDDLVQLQRSYSKHQTNGKNTKLLTTPLTKLAGITAAILIMIALGLFILDQQPTIGTKIAHEVSKNHLKLKPLEINSDQLSDLSNYFSQLDFRLVHTKILSDPNWELLGARYCSIQGNTAAQLRLKNKQTGAVETLYQAPFYEDQFRKVPILENNQLPLEKYAKGIGVNIWVEKGVLFALTNNSSQN